MVVFFRVIPLMSSHKELGYLRTKIHVGELNKNEN